MCCSCRPSIPSQLLHPFSIHVILYHSFINKYRVHSLSLCYALYIIGGSFVLLCIHISIMWLWLLNVAWCSPFVMSETTKKHIKYLLNSSPTFFTKNIECLMLNVAERITNWFKQKQIHYSSPRSRKYEVDCPMKLQQLEEN